MIEPVHPLLMLVQAFASQAVTYFAVVGLLYLVLRRWGRQRFAGARIQSEDRVDGRQLRFEVRNTMVVLLIGTATAVAISLLYAAGATRLTTDAAAIGWPTIVATFVGLVVFNDAWFYGWHRLLHHPWFFRHVHAIHHKSVDVNPFSSYSFHWFEGFVLGAWVLPATLVVPLYLPMLGVLQALGLANNVMSHLGYELFPRWWVRAPLLRWTNTATFHSLHHTSLRGNFGLMLRLWDRVFGTEVAGYEEAFRRRGVAPADTAASE